MTEFSVDQEMETELDDEKRNSGSILSQVKAEARKAKIDAARSAVKKKYADLIAARDVVKGIEDAIVADLLIAGEDEATIREILAGD